MALCHLKEGYPDHCSDHRVFQGTRALQETLASDADSASLQGEAPARKFGVRNSDSEWSVSVLACANAVNRSSIACLIHVPNNGLKNYLLPPSFKDVEYPERNKLKFIEKVPQYPAGIKPPKMMKNLIFMRGPEEIHNELINKQYGIVALQPGRMRFGHFEMVRMTIARRIDTDRMFAMWRLDSPWQPITKKSQGKRMGGGKGAIDHYITPIKYGRIIVEVGGHCEFKEVLPMLREVSEKLPFKAIPISNEKLQEMKEKERDLNENNINPYTLEYVIKNNMGKTHQWISPYDRKWYGKHI